MPYPETLESKPKIIFFTDFDGTTTLQDSNDWLTDNLGFGKKLRRQTNIDVLENRISLRDSFQGMMDSIKTPFHECVKFLLQKVKLDPHFTEFYLWAKENNVPVIVLSSGMTPIIRELFVNAIGPAAKDIEIVSNDVTSRPGKSIDEEGGWQIKFHDDSDFGHDKSLTIRPYAKHFADRPDEPKPTLLYAGDGVSDLSAAKETDLLFAKEGHDLVTYCEREGVPYTTFKDWKSIAEKTKQIFHDKTTTEKLAANSAKALPNCKEIGITNGDL